LELKNNIDVLLSVKRVMGGQSTNKKRFIYQKTFKKNLVLPEMLILPPKNVILGQFSVFFLLQTFLFKKIEVMKVMTLLIMYL